MTDIQHVTDFSRSYCFYVPIGHTIWVRIQAECVCEVIDTATGERDTYVLGVRTQTGLRTDPPSDALDPGYDFWMTFSKKHVYVKRNHASYHTNNPTRVPVEEFVSTGWHLEPAEARPILSAREVLEALKQSQRLVARTEFSSSDGATTYHIEYPIKWADGDEQDDAFRVETGPVLLLSTDHVAVGTPVEFDDFTWSYLDYRDFTHVRCLMERPTSILSGATYPASKETPRRHDALTDDQVKQIENRIFEGWTPPIPVEQLRLLLQTNHYSDVGVRAASTQIFSLEA